GHVFDDRGYFVIMWSADLDHLVDRVEVAEYFSGQCFGQHDGGRSCQCAFVTANEPEGKHVEQCTVGSCDATDRGLAIELYAHAVRDIDPRESFDLRKAFRQDRTESNRCYSKLFDNTILKTLCIDTENARMIVVVLIER